MRSEHVEEVAHCSKGSRIGAKKLLGAEPEIVEFGDCGSDLWLVQSNQRTQTFLRFGMSLWTTFRKILQEQEVGFTLFCLDVCRDIT